jgi:ribose transport system substrate-binding protein
MEDNMKTLASAAAIVAGLLVGPPAMAQTTPTIPIIVKDTTSPYWQRVLAGARKAGQELGVNVPELGAQSESDVNGQISILHSAVALKPAAIVIAPSQFAALGKPIDEAAKTMKVIGIDSRADSKAFTSLLATSDAEAGRLAADALAVAIKKTYGDTEGDVAVVSSLPGAADLDQRAKGFKEQIAEKYRAMAIVADKTADRQAVTSLDIMNDLIATQPELRGIFASSLVTAKAAAQSVAENKTNKTGDTINVVGFGWDDELVKFLQNGTIAAIVAPDPFRMGYDGIKIALAAAKGEKVPASVDTSAILITKANVDIVRSHEMPKVQ